MGEIKLALSSTDRNDRIKQFIHERTITIIHSQVTSDDERDMAREILARVSDVDIYGPEAFDRLVVIGVDLFYFVTPRLLAAAYLMQECFLQTS